MVIFEEKKCYHKAKIFLLVWEAGKNAMLSCVGYVKMEKVEVQ